MHMPKIEFKEMTLEKNIEIIKWAFFDEDDDILSIHNYTINYFPELASIDSDMSKKEINQLIEQIVKTNYQQKISQIKDEVNRYSKLWEEYNDIYFSPLTSLH